MTPNTTPTLSASIARPGTTRKAPPPKARAAMRGDIQEAEAQLRAYLAQAKPADRRTEALKAAAAVLFSVPPGVYGTSVDLRTERE